MTESDVFLPVTLKADDKVGVYFLYDEAGADELRDCLKADEVKFSFNPAEGAHLAEAGKVLFAFGQEHPRCVAETLASIGEEVLIDPAVVLPEDAYAPLVELFRRADDDPDEWVTVDLPRTLAEFGAGALGPLTDYLGDPAHGDWSRVAAAKAIGLVGKEHPGTRAECILRLGHQLTRHPEQSAALNAFLISPLVDLRAVEALPLIERAFAFGRVDETVLGDVEDVQIELGLKTQREHPRKPNALTIMGEKLRAQWQAAGFSLPDADGNFPEPEADLPAWDIEPPVISLPYLAPPKTGRNAPCPCGSGKKYKKCCGT